MMGVQIFGEDNLKGINVLATTGGFSNGVLGTQGYTVQPGDTLDDVAQRMYGDSRYAYLGMRERQWQTQMLGIENRYWRAVRSVESLMIKAKSLGQRWLKGAGRGQRAYE